MTDSRIIVITLCLGFLTVLGILAYQEVKELNKSCIQLVGEKL